MKISMQSKIQRAKRTMLGRTFCRIAGDRTGAVMMEYVILGVMIAAAATLAVIYFGREIVGGIATMTHATSGKDDAAKTQAGQNQDLTDTAASDANTSRKAIAGGDGNNVANH